MLKLLSLKSADEQDFLAALDIGFTDLEDAVQYQTALQIMGIDYFITSNIGDFKKASHKLAVITPRQFMEMVKKQKS